jgi:hypothetical protein
MVKTEVKVGLNVFLKAHPETESDAAANLSSLICF